MYRCSQHVEMATATTDAVAPTMGATDSSPTQVGSEHLVVVKLREDRVRLTEAEVCSAGHMGSTRVGRCFLAVRGHPAGPTLGKLFWKPISVS